MISRCMVLALMIAWQIWRKFLKDVERLILCLIGRSVIFMVKEGIVLGHVISERGIEVDKAKIETVERLPPPTDIKSLRSFLSHAGFYRRFINDFSKITKPLTQLLQKDVEYTFDSDCLHAFRTLKQSLISAPIMQPPDWNLPFEIMCDVSDYAVGAVLGQRRGEGKCYLLRKQDSQ